MSRPELLAPAGARVFTVESIFREDTGESVPCVTVAGHRVWIPVPFQAEPGDYLRKSVS